MRSASEHAEKLLSPLETRWLHVVAVATQAREVASALNLDSDILVAAAWLHDIGYAADLVATKLHALDGARHLRELGAPEEICSLVAHHTGARQEAFQRGLLEELLDEFRLPEPRYADALTYCDLTRGPGGRQMTVDERIAEILQRYGPGHVVHESVLTSQTELRRAARGIAAELAQSQYGTARPFR